MLINRGMNVLVTQSGKMFLSMLIWPRFFAPYRWQLTRYDMPLRNLPKAFDGYKILQLSDFHLGRTRLSYIHHVIDTALATRPDLVVITGDLIHYHPDGLAELPATLKRIHAPDGVLAIFGNHDYHEYSWRHVGERSARRAIHKRLRRIVSEHGVKLLLNQAHHVRRGSDQFTVVGLDEMWTGRADPVHAFAGIQPNDPVICLQHNPDGFTFLQDYPWQWMLCGHSHGGQANFPILGPLYVPMEHPEWIRGFYHFEHPTFGHRTMFVSTGIGHSTPIRMRVPPEATLFTLRPA